jgi:hypothetical protein
LPVTTRASGASSERLVQSLLDWTRKTMQLAVLAVGGLYAYVIYGLTTGAVGQWETVALADRARVISNVEGGLLWLNVSIGILLLTLCILYYDEESLGYSLVAAAVLLYYGVPFLVDTAFPSVVKNWESSKNIGAMAILGQFRVAGLMLAVPGGILLLRDLFLRLVDGNRRKTEEYTAMEYRGSVKEQAAVRPAVIGVLAKCWQLAYCRDAIRVRCPIFHHRTKCWKERVGCMCEENVIRHALDALINKEIISFEKPKEETLDEDGELIAGIPGIREGQEPTRELPAKDIPKNVDRRHVKIPHNPNLSMYVKRERCRNCVIYNEHQRLKYQFLAPILVLAVPCVAYWQLDSIGGFLNKMLATLDNMMTRLSLDPNATNKGIVSSITQTSMVAQYMVLGCLIVIVMTMAIRVMEWAIFKLKI